MNKMLLLVFMLIASNVKAQKLTQQTKWRDSILNDKNLFRKEYKLFYQSYNFDQLYKSKYPIYGFIGSNYTRLFIKFDSIIKDPVNSDIYHVKGNSRVGNNFTLFKGDIKVKGIKLYRTMHWGADDEYKNKGIKAEGLMFGTYLFFENATSTHSGKFSGITVSYFYIDQNNRIRYDDIEPSDSGNNNQFAGIWTPYNSKTSKVCNWGDSRIPLSGDLDIGAGDFSVNPKYKKFGWQDFKY